MIARGSYGFYLSIFRKNTYFAEIYLDKNEFFLKYVSVN